MLRRSAVLLAISVLGGLVTRGVASEADSAEQALAAKYAPVVRLVPGASRRRSAGERADDLGVPDPGRARGRGPVGADRPLRRARVLERFSMPSGEAVSW